MYNLECNKCLSVSKGVQHHLVRIWGPIWPAVLCGKCFIDEFLKMKVGGVQCILSPP